MGSDRYQAATALTITADCGGSNGYRTRLWKVELQHLADDLGFPITVCHLPPGTSKWNRIEHRLFSHITMNWRGKPLVSHEVIVNLIAATTTRTGLTVQAALDTDPYPKGIKSRSPTRTCKPSTSPLTTSTATGTTPSILATTGTLIPDEPLAGPGELVVSGVLDVPLNNSPSLVPCWAIPRCSCWTSRRARWTRTPSSGFGPRWTADLNASW